MPTVELKEPQLVAWLEHLATDRTELAERALETAVRQYLDTLEAEAIHAEIEAFWAMHAELMAPISRGAWGNTQCPSCGLRCRRRRLETRIRERFGAVPVLIAPVDAQRELRWRGGCLEALGTV